AMDTHSTTDLKKILEAMEADKKELAKKMQAMQEQIHELTTEENKVKIIALKLHEGEVEAKVPFHISYSEQVFPTVCPEARNMSKQFTWNPQDQLDFEELKKQLSSTPVLALPCFDEVFKVECDAFGGRNRGCVITIIPSNCLL
nr:RNA-directed DNA polymerase [Tanacetum cinerariifolium]